MVSLMADTGGEACWAFRRRPTGEMQGLFDLYMRVLLKFGYKAIRKGSAVWFGGIRFNWILIHFVHVTIYNNKTHLISFF
jgi:hypothetical protein